MWFWPILRTDPIGGLIHAFTYMSHYPYNPPNLYFGVYIPATDLPWHYLPVWLSITNPILVVVGFILSHGIYFGKFFLGMPIRQVWRRILDEVLHSQPWIAILAWGYGPIAAIILFKSILYDGWRQVFFIYPAFVLLACVGIQVIYELIPKQIPLAQGHFSCTFTGLTRDWIG